MLHTVLDPRHRKEIDRHLGDRIQPQHEIGGETAVKVGERVIRFQPVNDVTVEEGRQAVELHVAVPVCTANKIIAAACVLMRAPGANCKG